MLVGSKVVTLAPLRSAHSNDADVDVCTFCSKNPAIKARGLSCMVQSVSWEVIQSLIDTIEFLLVGVGLG